MRLPPDLLDSEPTDTADGPYPSFPPESLTRRAIVSLSRRWPQPNQSHKSPIRVHSSLDATINNRNPTSSIFQEGFYVFGRTDDTPVRNDV